MSTTANRPISAPPDVIPVRPFSALSIADVPYAGGKGANLGQLTRTGLPVPPGFVVGAPAYAAFRVQSGLADRLDEVLGALDVEDTEALRAAADQARQAVVDSEMPAWLADAIVLAYGELCDGAEDVPVAVRSSVTAEDTASASFAGMNETFLNVRGREAVIEAVKRCWQSLFGARTIYYRGQRGFGQSDVDIAVVIQRQIASTRGGVMFTIDPATGERDHLVIEGSFGLGEAVVSGQVSPDRYVVEKSTMAILVRSVRPKELTIEVAADRGTVKRALRDEESRRPVLVDDDVLRLAELGLAIEREYGAPQDTEWAFDPEGSIWMLQSRPITTIGAPSSGARDEATMAVAVGAVLVRGLGAAPGRASGAVRRLRSLDEAPRLGAGDVLVTHMTSPDWVPLMRKAAAVVTDCGGMTCQFAIVSRELGIPCVVGTGDATKRLRDGEVVTVDTTQGIVIEGAA